MGFDLGKNESFLVFFSHNRIFVITFVAGNKRYER